MAAALVRARRPDVTHEHVAARLEHHRRIPGPGWLCRGWTAQLDGAGGPVALSLRGVPLASQLPGSSTIVACEVRGGSAAAGPPSSTAQGVGSPFTCAAYHSLSVRPGSSRATHNM